MHKHALHIATIGLLMMGGLSVSGVHTFGQADVIEPLQSSGSNFSEDLLIPTVEDSTPLYGDTQQIKRDGAQTETEKIEAIESKFREINNDVVQGYSSQEIQSRADLLEKQKALDEQVDAYTDISQDIEDYTAKLTPLRQQIQTLAGQIQLLEQQIQVNQKQISSVELQINEKRIEIDELLDEIQLLEDQMMQQKDTVLQYMKLLYKHENEFYDFKTKKLNDLKLLLSSEGMAEVFRSERYLTLVEQSIRALIEQFERTRLQYEWKKEVLFTKQDRLRKLEADLVATEDSLGKQVEGKEFLLKTTLGQEAKYQILINEMRAQELESLREIETLQSAVEELQGEVTGIRKKASESVLTDEELRNRAFAVYKLGQGAEDVSATMFSWPVEPLRGISAYYRDPSYTKVFGVPHSAIDVPAPQSTPLLAPADAYVYKVKDNGYGYSYIILAHRGDFLTLYGHVSKILVNTGEMVKRGDVIGLSGGAPGTPGAGWMTTGPHLHFEVFKNGQHVDPLPYLDQTKLKTTYRPSTVVNPLTSPLPSTSANPLPAETKNTSQGTTVKRVQE